MTDDAAFGRKNQLGISQIASAEVGVSHIENTPGGLAPGLTNSSCDCGTSRAVSDQIAYTQFAHLVDPSQVGGNGLSQLNQLGRNPL